MSSATPAGVRLQPRIECGGGGRWRPGSRPPTPHRPPPPTPPHPTHTPPPPPPSMNLSTCALVHALPCTGLRVISADSHLLLRRVPPPAARVLEIGSTSPGALLYDARRLFDAQDARATGGIRSPIVSPMPLVQAPWLAIARNAFLPGPLSLRPAGQHLGWVHGSAALAQRPHTSTCLLARLWPRALFC